MTYPGLSVKSRDISKTMCFLKKVAMTGGLNLQKKCGKPPWRSLVLFSISQVNTSKQLKIIDQEKENFGKIKRPVIKSALKCRSCRGQTPLTRRWKKLRMIKKKKKTKKDRQTLQQLTNSMSNKDHVKLDKRTFEFVLSVLDYERNLSNQVPLNLNSNFYGHWKKKNNVASVNIYVYTYATYLCTK